MRTFAILLPVLLLASADAAPGTVTVETEHYVLTAETAKVTAQEYGRVLEAAWPKLREFFGAEPRLKAGERLRLVFCAHRESFARKLLQAGVQPPAAGGYYHLRGRTAYAWRQPTIYFTRCLLLHEAIHQFHYLAKTSNEVSLPFWYAEGIAEFLSRHDWDGKALTLGVVPMVTLEDSSRTALEALTDEGADRGADLRTLLEEPPRSRAVACAIIRWAVTADGGRHRKRFDRIAKKYDRGTQPLALLFRTFGGPKKLRPAIARWLATSQEPWSQIFNEWEGTSRGSFRGTAGPGIVSACRVKGDAKRISAVLKVPPTKGWMAGLLLSHVGPTDYTVALAVSGGAIRVHRRRGTKWERLKDGKLPGIVGKKTIRFEALRAGQKVRLRIDAEEIGEFELPGSALGLAIQGGVVEFSDVEWE